MKTMSMFYNISEFIQPPVQDMNWSTPVKVSKLEDEKVNNKSYFSKKYDFEFSSMHLFLLSLPMASTV